MMRHQVRTLTSIMVAVIVLATVGFAVEVSAEPTGPRPQRPTPHVPSEVVSCRSLQVYDPVTGASDTTRVGETVTVEGVVYVAPETYNEGGGGYLQDASGGINFWRDPAPTDIHVGDLIRITGSLWPHDGELLIGGYTYTKLASNMPKIPTNMALADLLQDFGNTGSHVRVSGIITDLTNETFRLEGGGLSIDVRRSAHAGVDFANMTEGLACYVTSPCLMQEGTLYLKPPRMADIAASNLYVAPSGSDTNPGTRELPFRTIQYAVDNAVRGGSVILFDGVYSGPGNTNVEMLDMDITIRSESGERDACVIECGGANGLNFRESETYQLSRSLTVNGLTIAGADTAIATWRPGYPRYGSDYSGVTIVDCRLTDGNVGVASNYSLLTITDTTASGNADKGVSTGTWCDLYMNGCKIVANHLGVALFHFGGRELVFADVEIVGNGTGMSYWQDNSNLRLSHCRVDSSTTGPGIRADTDIKLLTLENCLVRDNAGSGVVCRQDTSIKAIGCDISGNGRYGIEIYTGSYAWVALIDTRLIDNGSWGIGTDYQLPGAGDPVEDSVSRGVTDERSWGPVTFTNSEIANNGDGGAKIVIRGTYWLPPALITSTLITDNGGPGLMFISGSSTSPPPNPFTLTSSTVARNDGAGLIGSRGDWTISQTLIAHNDGAAFEPSSAGTTATFSCTDLYGNTGGDWTATIADQLGQNGNLSVDPRFCAPESGDYHLQRNSPLTSENNPGCGVIGRYDWNCPAQLLPFKPYLTDVLGDQGGALLAMWPRHAEEDPGSAAPVIAYELQRFEEDWQVVGALAAAAVDLYTLTISTPDILTLGAPAPYSRYRVVATTDDPEVFHLSAPDSAGSIDNLPPPKPEATLVEGLDYRYIVWPSPEIPDLASVCVFRGDAVGFTPGEPLTCPSNGIYTENHLAWYFYRVQFADIHGNLSGFSDELHGQWPTGVPGALPTALRLHPCRPNPFNPRTTITYDLPEAGGVRLAVFDLAGRLVRMLVDESRSQGSYEAVWDGRDAAGREVGSGTYLARIEFGGKVEVVRMGLVR